MQDLLRKFACLILAMTAALSLAVGTLLAHEGRPVGDYRFIVGWLEEPAFEGFQNAVSVRVNKVVDSEEAAAMGVQKEEHGQPGHHGGEPESTSPANPEDSSETAGHHETEDKDESSEAAGHHGTADSNTQASGGHHYNTIEAAAGMSVDINVTVDLLAGVNVQILTEGFTFAPENVNGAHVESEGHAHIYVDGVKVSRVYTPWFYLKDLTPGEREIRITLNANSHEEYAVAGSNVQAATRFTYHEPLVQGHAPETREADNRMTVAIRLEPDGPDGATLFVDTDGITFAPQRVGDHHVSGEGHAHVSVNGVDYGRLYGGALQLGGLAPGENQVAVTLNTNDFSNYTWNGDKVQATATINVGESMRAGEQDGHDRESSGSLIVPSGAAKPLASVSGQDEGAAVPVEGLEGALQVEVTHVATGASRTFDLAASWGDPGHYVAGLIPTVSGVYEFRIFGAIEGVEIDETFVSAGAGGDFDDVETSADLQFPEQLPELREVVGAAQGARDIAQQAQDTALAAQADGGGASGGGNVLATVALIIGIVGAVLGAGGIYLTVRARRSP